MPWSGLLAVSGATAPFALFAVFQFLVGIELYLKYRRGRAEGLHVAEVARRRRSAMFAFMVGMGFVGLCIAALLT